MAQRTFVIFILLGPELSLATLLLFLITEIRPITIRGWFGIFKTRSEIVGTIICRKKSNKVLDEVEKRRFTKPNQQGSYPSQRRGIYIGGSGSVGMDNKWLARLMASKEVRCLDAQLAAHARHVSVKRPA